jgi:hypothetical protein
MSSAIQHLARNHGLGPAVAAAHFLNLFWRKGSRNPRFLLAKARLFTELGACLIACDSRKHLEMFCF